MYGRRAVVLGASMAGLCATRVLSKHFHEVLVVERDELDAAAGSRKGIPQGNHVHGLLPSGYGILDHYFPDLIEELRATGASFGDITSDFLWFHFGRWKLRTPIGLRGVAVTRPTLELAVRKRVRALHNVRFMEGHECQAASYDPRQGRVTGLSITKQTETEAQHIDADLVIDASGRGSATPRWLRAWGFGAVPETQMRVDVGYATTTFERKPQDLKGACGALIAGMPPDDKRSAVLLAVEGQRWVVTLIGVLRDFPETELLAYRAFAKTLAAPDVYDLIKDRTPLSPIHAHRFQASRHRHYERVARMPRGLLVLGDAFCSFNPIYGQGMSVALAEAELLDACLSLPGGDLERAYFAGAGALVSSAWAMATSEDSRYPEVNARMPAALRLQHRYIERLHRAACEDPHVLKRFFEVVSLLKPQSALLSPSVMWRAMRHGV